MTMVIQDLRQVVEDRENNLYFEKNVSIPVKGSELPLRANVYRPLDTNKQYPVLVTYGPYGKDIHYGEYVGSTNPYENTEN